jgi:hypothetical protein
MRGGLKAMKSGGVYQVVQHGIAIALFFLLANRGELEPGEEGWYRQYA